MPATARAGQPFLTDDPVPTPTGHGQVYAPQILVAGKGDNFGGLLETEIVYGAAPGIELAVDVGTAYAHTANGWRWAAGDVRVSLKYLFYDDGEGFEVATVPGMTLPTAAHGMGAGRVTAFLPIWAQKNIGPWSVLGGGGYTVNPGSGNRDYWTGSIAVTRQVNDAWLVGAEVQRQGGTRIGGGGSTSAGIGAVIRLAGPLSLYASGGPTWFDHGGNGYHAFSALGLDF